MPSAARSFIMDALIQSWAIILIISRGMKKKMAQSSRIEWKKSRQNPKYVIVMMACEREKDLIRGFSSNWQSSQSQSPVVVMTRQQSWPLRKQSRTLFSFNISHYSFGCRTDRPTEKSFHIKVKIRIGSAMLISKRAGKKENKTPHRPAVPRKTSLIMSYSALTTEVMWLLYRIEIWNSDYRGPYLFGPIWIHI